MKLQAILNAERRAQGPGDGPPLGHPPQGHSPGCGGCPGKGVVARRVMSFDRLFALGSGFKALLGTVLGAKVTEEEYEARKTVCQACQAVDSGGTRLFRPFAQDPSIFTCGPSPVDSDPIPNRDPSKDGCGCFLNVKWIGQDNHCPLGRW